jgi:aspartate/methionine/tyrosine aminotransferase
MKLNHFKLERFFAKYEFNTPYLLCTSDCESFTTAELFDLDKNAEKEFRNLWLGYTESAGHPDLRIEISKLYAHSNPDDIIVFAGAEEGIFIFMNVLLDPGDQIIVQTPCYQSLTEIAGAVGCTVRQWEMDADKNWELDMDWLKKNITPKTKAIVVNFPNNPTGYTISREQYNRIVEIAREHDIFLFSDEVYRFLEYNPKDRLPAGCDIYDKAVSLGVMSKSFGLPGLRVGWIVTKDKALLQKIASFKDFTTICTSAPSEFLAVLALRHKEFILKRNLEIVKTNLRYLESFFEKYPHLFQWVKPGAGPLIFPRLAFTEDAEDFCLELIEKKGVLLVPGSRFNYRKNHVRIGFGRKNLPEALAKLEEFLDREPGFS